MPVYLMDHWPAHDPYGLEQDDHPEDGAAFGTMVVSCALQVWSACQIEGTATVQSAALAFNLTPDQVRHVVDHHYFMHIVGDQIEHDGEG
ncbi:hypothetical protein [Roseibium album]|uniref:hypothetical protein n=1 Tax=Roseibium album TaxID=311410 RepID=UPI00391C696D